MTRCIAVALCVVIQALVSTDAFQGPAVVRTHATNVLLPSSRSSKAPAVLLGATTESAFVPPTLDDGSSDNDDEDESEDDEDVLEKVEQLGRGGAKTKRGKRKSSKTPVKVNLAPEEVFYEGPPAITETIVPTVSILTVIGIIPAAAAWARQAWVRYKITSRRIRVTSGIAGKDMAEIVYPDVIELRTAKRLFGDGDLVAFLRDGAKFEMRNIPNFEETIEFILKHVSKDVAEQYRAKGDVTNAR